MHHKTFLLQGHDLTGQLTRFIDNYWQNTHESVYEGGFLRTYEEYSWMNSNRLVVCLRVDSSRAEQGELDIEIIVGGAGGGLFFSYNWGTERRRIKRFEKELLAFCRERGINLEVGREG